ncbi:MAG: hypothetical protein AAFN30_16695 [Actinomycetota bacterium]
MGHVGPDLDRVQIVFELQQMSWAGDCPGFYRDRNGRILAFHPGSIGRLRRELRELNEADWIVRAG